MLVKRRNQFEALQWDGSAPILNGHPVAGGPGGVRIVDTQASYLIESGDWVVFSASGKVIEVLSEADFADQFEQGAEVDVSWVAAAQAAEILKP